MSLPTPSNAESKAFVAEATFSVRCRNSVSCFKCKARFLSFVSSVPLRDASSCLLDEGSSVISFPATLCNESEEALGNA